MYFAVYKVKVMRMDQGPSTDFYEMEIEEVLKEGMTYC